VSHSHSTRTELAFTLPPVVCCWLYRSTIWWLYRWPSSSVAPSQRCSASG